MRCAHVRECLERHTPVEQRRREIEHGHEILHLPDYELKVDNTRAAVHSAGRAHMMAGFRVREWRVDPIGI